MAMKASELEYKSDANWGDGGWDLKAQGYRLTDCYDPCPGFSYTIRKSF